MREQKQKWKRNTLGSIGNEIETKRNQFRWPVLVRTRPNFTLRFQELALRLISKSRFFTDSQGQLVPRSEYVVHTKSCVQRSAVYSSISECDPHGRLARTSVAPKISEVVDRGQGSPSTHNILRVQ